MIANYFSDSRQMMMLEKVEIGGLRGNQLSSQVVQIYEEFQDLYAKEVF